MIHKKIYQLLEANIYVVIGICLGLLFWLLDAAITVYASEQRSLFESMLSLDFHEVRERVLVFFLNVGAGTHFQLVMNKRRQAENSLTQRNKELAALNAIATTISQSHSLDDILYDSLGEVLRLDFIGNDAKGIIFLLEPSTGRLIASAYQGAHLNHPCVLTPPKVGECLCGQAVQSGELIVSGNCIHDDRHSRHWAAKPHRDVCVPLRVRGEALGVMNLRLPMDRVLSENDTAVLTAVADQISIAIENARLSEQQQEAIAGERERIARELHDGLAQVLGYINTKTRAARLLLEKGNLNEAVRHLNQLEQTSHEVSMEVREAILGLKIAGQAGKGIDSLLQEMTNRFSHLSNLLIQLTVSPDIQYLTLDAETELQLLRISQEALSNVRKHAEATRAWVSLQVDHGSLSLSIEDDGKGFQVDQVQNQRSSFGLSNMQERARLVGGTFELETAEGAGTRIQVRMPLKQSLKV